MCVYIYIYGMHRFNHNIYNIWKYTGKRFFLMVFHGIEWGIMCWLYLDSPSTQFCLILLLHNFARFTDVCSYL